MTFREYSLRMKAHNLRRLDEEYMIALAAWQNQQVRATKKSGKNKVVPYFKTFKQFFDMEKYEREIRGMEISPEDAGETAKDRYLEYMRKQK